MHLDTLDRNALINEISDMARERGITGQEDWDELCDETVESHLDLAEFDRDESLENLKDALHLWWPEYQRAAGEMSPKDIDEDPEAERRPEG